MLPQGIFRCPAAPECKPREGGGQEKLDTSGSAVRALVADVVAGQCGAALASRSNWLGGRGTKRPEKKTYKGFDAYVAIGSTLSQRGLKTKAYSVAAIRAAAIAGTLRAGN